VFRLRGTLAALYVLATFVAQVGHDHGHAHHDDVPAPLAACADGGVHLADHPDAPDLGHPDADCPACLVRANPAGLAAAVRLAPAPAARSLRPHAGPLAPATATGPSRARAPPLA
jgi:hypothetical protein